MAKLPNKKRQPVKLNAIPVETTPRKITTAVLGFCEEISPGVEPVFVDVSPLDDDSTDSQCVATNLKPGVGLNIKPGFSPDAKPRKPKGCWDNVQAAIERRGGQAVTGWLIWEMPDVLLNAERYACWLSPDGELTDVTPKPDGETRIVFLSDPQPWTGQRVCPRLHPLCNLPSVKAYITAFIAERSEWAKNIDDFGLKEKLYDAVVALNASLSK